jgi:hypothetical protein
VSTSPFGDKEYGGVETTEDRYQTSRLLFFEKYTALIDCVFSKFWKIENGSVDGEF